MLLFSMAFSLLAGVESFVTLSPKGSLTFSSVSVSFRSRRPQISAPLFSVAWDTSETEKNLGSSKGKKDLIVNRRRTRNQFQDAKRKERAGRWKEACDLYRNILRHDPEDAHTHLALARLEARRQHDKAREAFQVGTTKCPDSVHLWQAWARYEESCSDVERARELFLKALHIDERNPYVCHSYGLLEKKQGNVDKAQELWEQGLRKHPSAALVCSLAELFIEQKKYAEARALYLRFLTQVDTEREMTELYLASAWLEEKYFNNYQKAKELIELALVQSPSSTRAQVALARLEGRHSRRNNKSGKAAARKHLIQAVQSIEDGEADAKDGRVFNALAQVEVKSRKFEEARQILENGIERYPDDVSVSSITRGYLICLLFRDLIRDALASS